MSDSDQIKVSFIEEASFGVTPAGNLQIARIIGETLGSLPESKKSAEIRSDRQVTDIIRSGWAAGGDLNSELSYSAPDTFMEAAMFSEDWVAEVDLSLTVSIVAATGTITDDGVDGFAAAVAGRWIKITGATIAANNGYFKILSRTDDAIVVAGLAALADDTAEALVIKMGAQIVNGTNSRSFSIEKAFTDLSNQFEADLGMVFNGFTFVIPKDGPITVDFSLMGKDSDSAAATIGDGYDDASTNDILNGIDHVSGFIDGTPVVNTANEIEVEAFEASLNNNLRNRSIIGTLGPVSIGAGKVMVSGIARMYFETATIMDKHIDWTETGLSCIIVDSDGNAYVLEFPAVIYTSGKRVAGGENTDIMADMEWEAKMHATELITCRLVRWAV